MLPSCHSFAKYCIVLDDDIITPDFVPMNVMCIFIIISYLILQGDSGGPLTFKRGGYQHVLIGTASTGNLDADNIGMAKCGETTMFARITSHLDWIIEVMTPSFIDSIFCALE